MSEQLLIGVDIGGTTIKIGVIKTDGRIVEKWEIKTNKDDNAKNIPLDIWTSIKLKLKKLDIDKKAILGIGVGAPGFVDVKTGEVSIAVNLGWKDFKLAAILKELSELPVIVDNDANIAAVGENWKGSGRLADNLIAITLGTGVGGGIIANGKVINGVNGTAGEIGHITVEPGGSPCNCGRNGCLETVASATGIVRQAKNAIQSGSTTTLNDRSKLKELTAKDVFELATSGDKAAQEIIDRVTDVLGLAIANMATMINPSIIVIGGGVSKAGEELLKPLRSAFESYTLPRIDEACEFVIATLGNDAGIIGGAYLVKQAQE
ncbi:ROK family glucokinase [Paraliobacillus sediminis]|uniref:ROK family glucokinase n=1 Tax=Paraliobacillus sediminis TaxID=1885916 RepID=UPI000E3E38EC|nr:ROK family glucokinase [Paraliobacillus sediminis]